MFYNGPVLVLVLLQAAILSSEPYNYFTDFWNPSNDLARYVFHKNITHHGVPSDFEEFVEPIHHPETEHVVQPIADPVHLPAPLPGLQPVHLPAPLPGLQPVHLPAPIPGLQPVHLPAPLPDHGVQPVVDHVHHIVDHIHPVDDHVAHTVTDHHVHHVVDHVHPVASNDDLNVYHHVEHDRNSRRNSLFKKLLYHYVKDMAHHKHSTKTSKETDTEDATNLQVNLNLPKQIADSLIQSQGGGGVKSPEPDSEYYKTVLDTIIMLLNKQNAADNSVTSEPEVPEFLPGLDKYDSAEMHSGFSSSGVASLPAKNSNRRQLDLDYEVIVPSEDEFNKNLASLNKNLKENGESSRRKGGRDRRSAGRRSKRRSSNKKSRRTQTETETEEENPVIGESRRSFAKDSSEKSVETKNQTKA